MSGSPNDSANDAIATGLQRVQSYAHSLDHTWSHSALLSACHQRNWETAESLIQAGICIRDKDTSGWTPLHLCVWHNAPLNLLECLLAKLQSQDVNAPLTTGVNALYLAVENPQVDPAKIRMLLDHGADPNQRRHETGGTAFLRAVRSNVSIDVMRVLLSHGNRSNIDLRNFQGMSAIYIAAQFNSSIDLVRMLIAHGCDPNARSTDGTCPLFIGVQSNAKYDVLEFLLENGAQPNIARNNGCTSLGYAVHHAHVSLRTIRLLLKYGANPYLKIGHAWSPLEQAHGRAGGGERLCEMMIRMTALVAFCGCRHSRLGSRSPAKHLSDDVLRRIGSFLRDDID